MQRASDRWVSIGLSVLLHAALLGALVYGWLIFRRPPPPRPTLAIEATVVDAKALKGAFKPPPQPAPPAAPAPAPETQEPTGPPPPTPEELAQREQQRQQAEAAQQQRRDAEQKAAEQRAEAQAKQAEEQRKADEHAASERKAREAAEARKRAAAEERQRQAEAQESSEREADLKRSLAAEEQAAVARSGAALASWESQIAAKITRAWLRPPTARPGIQCVLNVTQVPGGEVTQVSIGECNGDQAVRESIEAAAYRASPLPPPPDPALFDRNLKINFKPD
jgi:colicin import membrane protein